MANWKVVLAVSGPITVEQTTKFNAQKGSVNPFWSKMKVTAAQHGVKVELVARADDQEEANEAALYFVGQALDYLSLKIDLPLYVSLSGTQFKPLNDNVKRILDQNDWIEAFINAREINANRRVFSRGLSWYRKGLVSEDPIDSFLSFWSSIECIGSKFARDSERTRRGVINKICDCFDLLWVSSEHWKAIPNEPNKVNQFHELRNGIAHGYIRVDIENLKRFNVELPLIKLLSREFLRDWESGGVRPEDLNESEQNI